MVVSFLNFEQEMETLKNILLQKGMYFIRMEKGAITSHIAVRLQHFLTMERKSAMKLVSRLKILVTAG